MTRRDFEPPPRTFTKPPIKRVHDPRIVRQDRWARWVGWLLAVALVPPVLAGVAARGTGMWRLPDVVVALLGTCALIGFGGALVLVVAWAIVDRD